MSNTEKDIRDKIIKRGVSNLKEFGYEHCTEENILTDEVYKLFFKKQLQDAMQEASNLKNKDIINVIDSLLNQIK